MRDKIEEIFKNTHISGIVRRLKANTTLWEEISNNCSKDTLDIEKIYLYIHNKLEPKCQCGSNKKLRFISFSKGYNECCSNSCSFAIKLATERRVESLKKSGGIGLANPKIKEKARKTLLKKSNVSNPGQLEKHKEYMRTNNPMFNIEAREHLTTNNPLSDPNIIEKIKKHYIDTFGVENNSQKHWSPETFKNINDKDWMEENFKNHGSNLKDILNVNLKTLYKYLFKHGLRQPYEYTPEKNISEFISSLGFECIKRSRQIIYPQELDIIIPDKKLAIEYCGLYWHSEDVLDNKQYHFNKMKKTEEQGFRLITIFEDEWLENRHIVESTLRHILGKSDKTIYARKCQMKNISLLEYQEFMKAHHLMGKSISPTVALGLFYENSLVAAMGFRKIQTKYKRLQKYNSVYDLIRFSTNGANVIGAASKLFENFKKTHNPDAVISYADARWSQGQLYKTLGFEDDGFDPPNYSYIKKQQRFHKFNLRKNRKHFKDKYPKEMTESQITKLEGYEKIWDCGRYRFIWIRN